MDVLLLFIINQPLPACEFHDYLQLVEHRIYKDKPLSPTFLLHCFLSPLYLLMSLDALRNTLPSLDSIKSTIGMAPNLPKTYKAAVFKEAGGPLVFEDVELKEPEAGHILIKVLATGVCHTDMAVKHAMMGPL